METSSTPRVVILGGGFAGLETAKALRNKPVSVTLVDRHNYHLFQPLLYQVATSSLQPADIAGPIRQIVRAPNVEVLMGEVEGIDATRQVVTLADRELPYDHLVVATGATHSYFGNDAWEQRAPGLKSLEDAVEIRRRILSAFEAAEREPDPILRLDWLTFVVIGAGPTGVELAGALAEIARGTHATEFKQFDPKQARVILVEGLPRVLSAYSEELSASALEALQRKGVEVRTNTRVTDVGDDYVVAGDERIPARTALWAAGVAASPIVRSLDAPLDKAGRVLVTPELTVPNHPSVFVVGDLVALTLHGKPVPGLAPVAMAMGKYAAKSILRTLQGKPREPFDFWDRGSFAVIGRGAAVGNMFQKLEVSGYFAWLAWLAIHVAFLVGFRNRVAVMLNWAYAYLTNRRHAQLIIGQGPTPEARPALTESGEHKRAPEQRDSLHSSMR